MTRLRFLGFQTTELIKNCTDNKNIANSNKTSNFQDSCIGGCDSNNDCIRCKHNLFRSFSTNRTVCANEEKDEIDKLNVGKLKSSRVKEELEKRRSAKI